MSPLAMLVVLSTLLGLFAWSAWRRWELLAAGAPTWESRVDRLGERLRAVWVFAFWQRKLRYYFWAGLAHNLIFAGFLVLLLRTLVLWGRGFDPWFNLFFLGPETALGQLYALAKDVFALLVLLGVGVFAYYRVVRPQRRMTLGVEGLVILGIIATMMASDLFYDGAVRVLWARYEVLCPTGSGAACRNAALLVAPYAKLAPPATLAWHAFPEPGGSAAALLLAGLPVEVLVGVGQAGFWMHATLVLVFLNILPYSKHFHILTAVPNVLLGDLTPPGRLRPLAPSTEALLEQVEKASELDDPGAARIGYARLEHFTWKDRLDFFTCTECGRCSDNCPAFVTGKKLSPKQLTLALRDHMVRGRQPPGEGGEAATLDLVPSVVEPEVLWACTTCRACEEQCPVNISYVDKIVQLRRNLVSMRGEFPSELAKPFEGMERNGNPWNLSRLDRAAWTEGLEVRRFAEHPTAEVLYWVGCAASYDDRARRVARATARLLGAAGVDFAILGDEECCTGDPARRAGNEYLFTSLAEGNVATLRGYQEAGGARTILATCPHCFNTLRHEYRDFGGDFEVVHHTEYLLGLVRAGRLTPRPGAGGGALAYHDSCYLGRYNGVYDAPRELLRAAGAELVEVVGASREKGLCCGAGGAQMWMEEQNAERVNVRRTRQLLGTGAQTVAVACPFCMTMVSDGLKAESKDETVRAVDVAELLADACLA